MDGGSKKLKKPSEHALNGMFPKGPPTHGHPCPKCSTKRCWQCQCSSEGQVVAWSWEAGMVTTDLPLVTMYAPAWRCIPASMTSRLHHQSPFCPHHWTPSPPYYVLPPITATLDIWGRSSVWLCYLQQSNAWQQRSCPCSGRMRTKPLLKF